MKKLVFDADGLIKLAKAGMTEAIAKNYTCIISEQVYEEVVIEGKKRLHQDAFEIERLIEAKKIKVISIQLKESNDLGKGELSTYKIAENNIIVSDDRKFLSFLQNENKPFIVPAHFIAALAQKRMISKKEGIGALNRIKKLITTESYTEALHMLEEK